MSDFNSLVQYTVENISRPVKYIIYKLTEFIRVVDKFVFRQVPSGAASGYATIEQIEGNTLVWNQLVDTSDTSCTVPNGHKYYSIIGGTKSISTSDGTSFAVTGGTDVVIDLTQIFGAGNEPTTVADFEAWMAQNGLPSITDYNAGELLSVKMSGIQTEDSSQQTIDTLPFDVTTITGINTSTNVREVIFPNGMKWSNNVSDILNIANDTATVNIGTRVFDGTEAWEHLGNSKWFSLLKSTFANLGTTVGSGTYPCSHFIKGNRSGANPELGASGFGNSYFNVNYDNTTTTPISTFTNYLATQYSNGTPVTLVYPLATPIIYTDLQDANGNLINPRYNVEQGGTEQVLPVNTSSPTTVAPTLTTTYTKDVH